MITIELSNEEAASFIAVANTVAASSSHFDKRRRESDQHVSKVILNREGVHTINNIAELIEISQEEDGLRVESFSF